MNKVTVIGSINMDISICANTFPKIGETVNGYDFRTQPGGKGSNQAITIGRLKGDVSFLGCLGDDSYGTLLHRTLEDNDVDTSHTITIPEQSSGTAVIFVYGGDNSIVINGGANHCMTPKLTEEHAAVIKSSKILLSQLEIPMDAVLTAFRIARENGVTTILNPAPIAPLPDELLRLTDIIILNQTEAAFLTGQTISTVDDAKTGIDNLLNRGMQKVIITLGSLGCIYTDDDGAIIFHPARKVTAVDTTGAGDSFCGAFAYGLANHFPIGDAIRLATVVSSVTVTRRGAALSTPTEEEVNKILKEEGILYELS